MTTFRASFRLVLLMAVCLVAPASGVVLFLDTGSSVEGVQEGPVTGYNPLVSAYPTEQFSLYVWAIPGNDPNRVVASLGHSIQESGAASESLSCEGYVLANAYVGDRLRWDGTALVGGLNSGDLLVDDQRAVFVPVGQSLSGGIGSGLFAQDQGYDAASGAVYIGRLDLALDANAPVGSTAELRFLVGPLLIAQVTTGTWADEPVYFGYYGGMPEAADGTGSDLGATSDAADASIFVTNSPADFDTDGDVDVEDFSLFSDCLVGPDVSAGLNCDVADIDDDGDVDLDDFSLFQLMFTGAE